MNDISVNRYSLLTEQLYRFGENFPFGFFHNTLLKAFGGVVLLYINRLLKNDRPCVAFGGNYMHRCARNLNALGECRLVNAESVVALSAEGGNKGGVNIYYAVGESFVYLLVDYGEEARKHHKVNACSLKLIGKRF